MTGFERRLAGVVAASALFALAASALLARSVAPALDRADLPLAARVASPKFGDAAGYGGYAQGILAQRALRGSDGEPILRHMPGFPLVLAATFGVSGSARPLLALQVLCYFTSLCFLLVRLRRSLPEAALLATPVLMALHPFVVKHSAAAMSDLLFAAALLCVGGLLHGEPAGRRPFLLAGLVFGLAAYLRESALPFALATALAFVVRDRRRYLSPAVGMLLACLLLLVPWALRNAQVVGRPLLLTTKTRELLYYSSIPLTRELYEPFGPGLQEGGYDYGRLYRVYHEEAQRWGGPPIREGAGETPAMAELRELYSPWRQRWLPPDPLRAALENYLHRPQEQLVSLLLRILALFNKPGVLVELAGTPYQGALLALSLVLWAFHAGVILLGVGLAFTRWRAPLLFLPYLLVAQLLQSLLLWSEARYLLPFYPFLILLALSWYARPRPGLAGPGGGRPPPPALRSGR